MACLALMGGSSLGATPDQAPPVAAGMARVWFLRQLIPGSAMYAPWIYANGAAVAISPQGSAFYRDFQPGTYLFTVENCIPEPGTSFSLALASGNQFALQIQSDPNAPGDCVQGEVDYVRPVPPEQLSQTFAPLVYLGER
jgi:hypothetical protein